MEWHANNATQSLPIFDLPLPFSQATTTIKTGRFPAPIINPRTRILDNYHAQEMKYSTNAVEALLRPIRNIPSCPNFKSLSNCHRVSLTAFAS